MSESPLAEVIRDRRINGILEDIRKAVRTGRSISIPPKDVDYIRRRFPPALLLGERKLYEFAQLLLGHFAPKKKISVSLIVWGRCSESKHIDEVMKKTFDLTDRAEELLSISDTLLSEQQAPPCRKCGRRTTVIASYVSQGPEYNKESILLFLLTRIKTTSNICYKIADLVFDIDWLLQRDKIHHDFSQIVTDVYGVKAIVRHKKDIDSFLDYLCHRPGAEVIGEKDYTGPRRKKSGFEAHKVFVRRQMQLFEVQVQSKKMYETELSSRTANHRTYKERLMADRRKLGREYVQLYRLLNRLLTPAEKNYSEIAYLELAWSGKGLDDTF